MKVSGDRSAAVPTADPKARLVFIVNASSGSAPDFRMLPLPRRAEWTKVGRMDPVLEIALRLVAATLVGGVIGLNRDLHGKPTGVRTMGLVGLGSALIVAVAGLVGGNGDATRAVQGIVTGIGFLGAGVIVKDSTSERIHGLTTAASIWLTAALGVTSGLGHWVLALVATGLSFVVLMLGGPIEKAIHRRWPHKPEDQEMPP
jgi:putative Mg2+ transporter-C (MgtC) family protein